MIRIPLYDRVPDNPQWVVNWVDHVRAQLPDGVAIDWKHLDDSAKSMHGSMQWQAQPSANLVFDCDENYVMFPLRWT